MPTVGSVVESTNVPVIVDAYPTYPVPVSVNPCAATDVLDDARDATPTTFVNVKDVDAAEDGVHKNVNAVPVDPDNEPIVPFDRRCECDGWKCCGINECGSHCRCVVHDSCSGNVLLPVLPTPCLITRALIHRRQIHS